MRSAILLSTSYYGMSPPAGVRLFRGSRNKLHTIPSPELCMSGMIFHKLFFCVNLRDLRDNSFYLQLKPHPMIIHNLYRGIVLEVFPQLGNEYIHAAPHEIIIIAPYLS